MESDKNSAKNLVVFAHGMESGPWGTKITALAQVARDRGWAVESPDFTHTKHFDERVAHLLQINPQTSGRLVLVGSSMGGYVMAHTCAALKPDGLFLMAPALYFEGYDSEPQDCPQDCVVVHGWNDDVVPLSMAQRFSEPRKAALHIVNSEHTLASALPLIERLFAELLDRLA